MRNNETFMEKSNMMKVKINKKIIKTKIKNTCHKYLYSKKI